MLCLEKLKGVVLQKQRQTNKLAPPLLVNSDAFTNYADQASTEFTRRGGWGVRSFRSLRGRRLLCSRSRQDFGSLTSRLSNLLTRSATKCRSPRSCPLSPQIRATLETSGESPRPNWRGEGELKFWWRQNGLLVALLLAVTCFSGCSQAPTGENVTKAEPQSPEAASIKPEVLFDGKTLDRWELTSFGGEGDCYVEGGAIVLTAGDPITAINLPEEYDLPTDNYELLVEAKRVEGTDFFATVTFPVGDSFCSLVVGGWAGTLIGLSSVDGEDASTNETRSLKNFEDDRWYRIRLRVAEDNISAWIDDERVVDLNTVDRKISLRGEMIPCRPLGIASFITTAAIRKVELRRLENKTDANEADDK